MSCPRGKILNKWTNKCVKKDGKIGKAILAKKYTPRKHKSPFDKHKDVKCEKDKIVNPITGKCVKKDGKVGKTVSSLKLEKYDDCPPGKISNPNRKGCISVYGQVAQK